MKTDFFKILLILLLALTACRKSADSSPSLGGGLDILNFSDETDDAARLVAEANLELKKVKAIYKSNEASVKDLQAAISSRDTDKVKEIAGNLVIQINTGLALAENAVDKIDKAEDKQINDTYRRYLDLKKAALRKQIEAFNFRRESAVQLRDGFGGKNKLEVEKTKAALKQREDDFKRYIETAREMSEEANQIAKDSLNQ